MIRAKLRVNSIAERWDALQSAATSQTNILIKKSPADRWGVLSSHANDDAAHAEAWRLALKRGLHVPFPIYSVRSKRY